VGPSEEGPDAGADEEGGETGAVGAESADGVVGAEEGFVEVEEVRQRERGEEVGHP
jgi:hypothetical protein